MKLSQTQLKEIEENGYIILPDCFLNEEVNNLRKAMTDVFKEKTEANIIEKSSGVVRTATGLHLRSKIFDDLTRHPKFFEPARQIRGDNLYIQQTKINVKAAFTGEAWQWHYDFATHFGEDGVPKPLALNLHVFLDDVTEFNGPLFFIPKSHKYGSAPSKLDTVTTNYPLWVVDQQNVKSIVKENGIASAHGKAGTVVIFVDNLVHGSAQNMSPMNRAIFSVILNPCDNAQTKFARPEYKHGRDFKPIEPSSNNSLK
jgi:ectoine hydroxylase